MNYRKVLITIPVVCLAASIAGTVTNAAEPKAVFVTSMIQKDENVLYDQFSGKVVEIRDLSGKKAVRLENEEGGLMDFIVGEDTVFAGVNGLISIEDIAEGDMLSGYYNSPQAAILIYPPQYEVSVLYQHQEKESMTPNIKVDRFNADLISEDNDLKLNISEDTIITDIKGNIYEGDLADKDLMVYYTITTRSIPAQTSPERIIVLEAAGDKDEPNTVVPGQVEAVHPIYQLSEEEMQMFNDAMNDKVTDAPIIVNGTTVEAPSAYVNGEGVMMLPLRAVAESLGYEVHWDGETSSVVLGVGISLKVGENNYIVGRMAPLEFSAAPEMIDGVTYAPVDFIQTVLEAGVMITDDGILINTIENGDSK